MGRSDEEGKRIGGKRGERRRVWRNYEMGKRCGYIIRNKK